MATWEPFKSEIWMVARCHLGIVQLEWSMTMPARMCEHGELYDLALGIEPIDQCQECLDDYLMLIDGVDYYGFVSELPDDVHVIA